MRIMILSLFLVLFSLFPGINTPELGPSIGPRLRFDEEVQARFNTPESFIKCEEVWANMTASGRKYKDLTREELKILDYCSETREDIWDIVGVGCSWYCGGVYSVVGSSSSLQPQGKYTYGPENAGDLHYGTAWVEGVKGYGIGETITYAFPPETPRITKIIVVNGYVKSEAAYRNNSRVKKLKLYVNGSTYAILNLEDVIAEQKFTIEPIGYNDRDNLNKLKSRKLWKVTFEILEVYKGDKYEDTAITEIYFDGIDVH